MSPTTIDIMMLAERIRPALAEHIHPLLHGHPPEVQSAAIADLAATYLAGIAPPLRPKMRKLLIDLIDVLIPLNEGAVFGDAGHPFMRGRKR